VIDGVVKREWYVVLSPASQRMQVLVLVERYPTESLLPTYEHRFRVILDPVEWRAKAMSKDGPR
jgi:hypothetical protein